MNEMSPSPRGRLTKYDRIELQYKARQHADAAFETLLEVMASGKSDTARTNAAIKILEMGYGKLEAPVEDAKTIEGTTDQVDELTSRILSIATNLRSAEAAVEPLTRGEDGSST